MQQDSSIIFSSQLVNSVGSIKDVLGEFLDKQILDIQMDLEKVYAGVPTNAVEKLLDEFVTLEGTKKPMNFEQIQEVQLSEEQLSYCLSSIEKSRILRFEENQYELAHDTLALNIAERRSFERVQVLQVKKTFDRYELRDKSSSNILSKKELRQIQTIKESLLDQNTLSTEELDFLERSERIYRLRSNRILFGSFTLSIIFLTLTIVAVNSSNQSKERLSEIKRINGEIQTKNQELEDAIGNLRKAQAETKAERKKTTKSKIAYRMNEASSFVDKEDYESAENSYKEIESLIDTSRFIDLTPKELSQRKEELALLIKQKEAFDSFIEQGNEFLYDTNNVEYGKLLALRSYEKALYMDYQSPRRPLVLALKKQAEYSLEHARESLQSRFEKYAAAGDTVDLYRQQAIEIEQEINRRKRTNQQ